VEINLKMDVT